MACWSIHAALGKDGYIVLRRVLPEQHLAALRAECDLLCMAAERRGEAVDRDADCVVDALSFRPIPEGAAARTDPAAFRAARSAAVCAAASAAGREGEANCADVLEALLGLLPAALRRLSAQQEEAEITLFNEQFVVKPSQSTARFAWHTDGAEQTALCLRAPPAPYLSVWIPLDDCDRANGTLCVLPAFRSPPAEALAGGGSDGSGLGGAGEAVGGDVPGAVLLPAEAGDAVVFSSLLWHCSGPNETERPRRVFYAQFSEVAVTDGSCSWTPLSLAVPL